MGPEKVNRDTSVWLPAAIFERFIDLKVIRTTECELYTQRYEAFEQLDRNSKHVHHAIIYWVKQLGGSSSSPGKAKSQKWENRWTQTFVHSKKNKIYGCGYGKPLYTGILACGRPLCWNLQSVSYWLLARQLLLRLDGYKGYQSFIDDGDHIVNKTYMTKVESENTRLRHYLARLHPQTLCYSKSVKDVLWKYSIHTLLHCKYQNHTCTKLVHPIFSNYS